MNGLFGDCDHSDGSSNDGRRERMQAMSKQAVQLSVVRARGPSIVAEHGDGVSLALCVRCLAHAGLPDCIERQDHLWLAFAGRLDHRQDLDRELGIADRRGDAEHCQEKQGLGDAAVVMAAYRRFGLDCVDRLNGDWAFALWDARDRRLVLARDATGISSLFWWSGGGRVLFASSMPVLLAAGPVPKRPDPRWMAGLLTVFVDSTHPSGTAFQDVHALPAGHLLVAQGGHTELKRWWRPELLAPLWHEDLPQLQQRFVSAYQEAVRTVLPRAGHKVAATLSGGLDSGSVVALAAPMLAKRGQRLTAYVQRPSFDATGDHPTRNTDEWDLAMATARHVGNVDVVSCRTSDVSPLEGIRRWLDMTTVPSHAAGNWFWLLDIARQAASSESEMFLVGQAGNSAVSYAGSGNLWPRVWRLQPARVWSELRGGHFGVIQAATERLLKPALRPAWWGLKRALKNAPAEPAWRGYSLINPRLERDVGLAPAMRAAGHDPTFTRTTPAAVVAFRLTLLGGVENGASVWNELGRSHGFNVCDPTRDRKLIELCWRLPDELFWAQGKRRGLVRVAMRDLLPAQVLDSNQRGQQAADLRQRLQACRPEMLSEVERLALHPVVREWIDTERFRECAKQVVAPNSGEPSDALHWPQHFMRTFAAAEFVSRHA